MFNKRAMYDDFNATLEKELHIQNNAPAIERQAKLKLALDKIVQAANLLDEVGLEKNADLVTKVLVKVANESPASGMPKKMNETSWVFKDPTGKQPDGDGKIDYVNSKSNKAFDAKSKPAAKSTKPKTPKAPVDELEVSDTDVAEPQSETTEAEKAEKSEVKTPGMAAAKPAAKPWEVKSK